jgi:hypothetical protein
MPSWKSTFGSYLSKDDLQGRATNVVLAGVELSDVKDNETGKTEKRLVVSFVGKEKTLILNRTNCEALETICGTDDYGRWPGHAVQLYTDPNIKFGGKTVGGLRIRAVNNSKPAPSPPPVVDEISDADESIPF